MQRAIRSWWSLVLSVLLVLVLTGCQGEGGQISPEAIWASLQAFVATIVAIPEVKFLGAHVLLNVVVAIAAAIHTAEFKFHKLAEFLWRKLLPFVIVYTVARLLGDAAQQSWLAVAVMVLIETSLLADLGENLIKLGIKVPESVARFFTKIG